MDKSEKKGFVPADISDDDDDDIISDDRCDLNPDKLCNNCCKCIMSEADYNAIVISKIMKSASKDGKKH